MINHRRSELEIICNILTISKGGARKTEIMYRGNFCYSRLEEYLSYLKNNNIIEEIQMEKNGSSFKLFKLTEKGLVFLEDANKVLSHLECRTLL